MKPEPAARRFLRQFGSPLLCEADDDVNCSKLKTDTRRRRSTGFVWKMPVEDRKGLVLPARTRTSQQLAQPDAQFTVSCSEFRT
ncbi:hypothetical protein BS78_06G160500 [Paspalum vaginatum]|nr:hypothetical protein BS78_06G160500 [Paspalum vaginatum]